MLTLAAKTRETLGKKTKALRKKGILPAVLYGSKLKTARPLELDEKHFEKIYKEAGESSLISLEIESKKTPVLIHEVQQDPLTGKPLHVDFYQPSLEEEVEVTVPLIFEGESLAVKDFGGTLVRNVSEIEVKALPQNLPHEIKVSVDGLKTFDDVILIKDLVLPEKVKTLRDQKDIVASVSPLEKVEEELEKPIEEKEEKAEEIEKEGKEEKEEREEKEGKEEEEPQEKKEVKKST